MRWQPAQSSRPGWPTASCRACRSAVCGCWKGQGSTGCWVAVLWVCNCQPASALPSFRRCTHWLAAQPSTSCPPILTPASLLLPAHPCAAQDLGTALRRDVNGALASAGSEEAAALGRLEARLAVRRAVLCCAVLLVLHLGQGRAGLDRRGQGRSRQGSVAASCWLSSGCSNRSAPAWVGCWAVRPGPHILLLWPAFLTLPCHAMPCPAQHLRSLPTSHHLSPSPHPTPAVPGGHNPGPASAPLFTIHTTPHHITSPHPPPPPILPLQSLEGAIQSLQSQQSEGMQRLNSGFAAALDDATTTLQVRVTCGVMGATG